jgi:hypothetical protein
MKLSYNLLKNFKNLIYKIFYSKLKKIERFKNLHQGEKCLIFGDGASIKWVDLKKFSNYISITVGYIPFHNNFQYLNCKYCLFSEPFWFAPFEIIKKGRNKLIFNSAQKKYREIIRKNKNIKFFLNLSNIFFLNRKNIFFLFKNIPNSNIVNEFYKAGINPFHGSFRTSILLSIYLGFNEATLVGFDYTHTPSRFLHWYEVGEGLLLDEKNYEIEFLKIASKFIKLKTLTINGGYSNKMDYISYETYTGSKEKYKENFEIIDMQYLNALKKWPNYKI